MVAGATGRRWVMKLLAICVGAIAVAALLVSCSASRGYESALSEKQAIEGNSHAFPATSELTFRAVTGTLVQEGFIVDQIDAATGLIKATRNYTDPKAPDTNYHITATAYVTRAATNQGSLVTMAASEQTVLYRKGHSWTMFPLLPIIPIPTGRKFETVTTGEGGIVSGGFYRDFFTAVQRTLAAMSTQGTATDTSDRPASIESAISAPDR
jgi:hypothetical protein